MDNRLSSEPNGHGHVVLTRVSFVQRVVVLKIALLSAGLFLGLALIPAFGGLPGSETARNGAPRWQAPPEIVAAEPEPCIRLLRKVETLRGERARYKTACGAAAGLLLSDMEQIPMPTARPRD